MSENKENDIQQVATLLEISVDKIKNELSKFNGERYDKTGNFK